MFRTLRSKTKPLDQTSSATISSSSTATPSTKPFPSPIIFSSPSPPQARDKDSILFYPLGTKLPHISKSDLLLLRQKQIKLRSTASSTLSFLPLSTQASLLPALLSTLIFAQSEAGTAVSISPSGWILTCAHCFGDTNEEYENLNSKKKWMLFYDGTAVCVECKFWDGLRDLALCRVVGIEVSDMSKEEGGGGDVVFKYLTVSTEKLKFRTPMLCIGQPGAEDLESSLPNKKTKYNLVEISEGTYRGMVIGSDPQINKEIGSLKHDCWTYWGHSGAPLVEIEKGRLAGVHSSWDEETGMRHGVPGVAIGKFLEECGVDFTVNFEAERDE